MKRLIDSQNSVLQKSRDKQSKSIDIVIFNVSIYLSDIFNLSIAIGVFPDSWKIARVTPIFKSGKADDRSNHWPISVLPVLSRIFEKLIFNQLHKYLDTNKHLFPKKSVFCVFTL